MTPICNDQADRHQRPIDFNGIAPPAILHRTYPLPHIAAMLGQQGRSQRWLLTHVASLIEHADFPPPLPLTRAGVTDRTPRAASQWPAIAVDDWFNAQLPPGGGGGQAAIDAARDMDARAFRMRCIERGRT